MLDVEEPLYEVTTLLHAASLLNQRASSRLCRRRCRPHSKQLQDWFHRWLANSRDRRAKLDSAASGEANYLPPPIFTGYVFR